MGSMVTRLDAAEIKDRKSRDEVEPCPMCGKRHVLDIVGNSAMSASCFAAFREQHREVRAINARLIHERDEQRAG